MYALYHPPPFNINLPDHSFGELALLFPNTDINIVMFGSSAYNITHQAKPSTIAAQKYAYEFHAPEQSGSFQGDFYQGTLATESMDCYLPLCLFPDE
jgi:hypothetical protein